MTQDQAPDVHTMFAELTQPHSHREPYVVRRGGTTWTQHHVTRVPALVMQLLEATPAGSGDQAGTGGHSRPAIRIEALDTVMLIDDEVSRWIERLGSNTPADVWDVENDRPVKGSGTLRALRHLHGLHASAPICQPGLRGGRTGSAWCCLTHRLEHDLSGWWHQARIVSGWDTPAFRPFAACPICEAVNSLRVKLTAQTALCVECRALWDPTTIGMLAEHIREAKANDTPAPQVESA
ncbi:DUF7341 domain-containing protein [Nocardioides jensenii]|uniref:DUF7341 domain-containing protein n=1 Tax=Nocardioides jensenii TaxID=1843 RepID=UPI0008337CB2|nr:hypothetical protein [Nocardioides jensenii]